ncbi:hypothetical protein IWW47_004964, partial [Coemansia sp. RSA 2052]
RWSFWNKSAAADDASTQPPPSASPAAPASAEVGSEADAAARELAELGISVREMPSTLPALVLPSHEPLDVLGSSRSGDGDKAEQHSAS